jgi:hypothetical protein
VDSTAVSFTVQRSPAANSASAKSVLVAVKSSPSEVAMLTAVFRIDVEPDTLTR